MKSAILTEKSRTYIPNDLNIQDWKDIEPFFTELDQRPINNKVELLNWIKDRSELEAILEEDLGWRYIRMSCNTQEEKLQDSYEHFISEIEPHCAPFVNRFNIKLTNSPFLKEIETLPGYFIYLRGIKQQISIFREENIPVQTEIQKESQKYGAIAGAMTIVVEGKELTLQQAAKYLKDADRQVRQNTYLDITKRRIKEKDTLNALFSSLLTKRHQLAKNAGFDNFTDYMFVAMGRFDYSVKDCLNFHQSIGREITPMLDVFDLKRKTILAVEPLKPWDLDVDISGKAPLKPFQGAEELVKKTVNCFNKVHPEFAAFIQQMEGMGHLDLESRKGKAPGGYNYPLYETGVPFIFMNAVGTLQDVVTMVHEGGHAVHSFLSRHLPVTEFKSVPSEVAELASMSMELISMEHWETFFEDKSELIRAKREQLEKVLRTLPWVATIDKFQHWIYSHPSHSEEERKKAWVKIMNEFSSQIVDWSGAEEAYEHFWQKQLHLFEVPFYYIEYGMAQLGAIAMWKNYKNNPEKTLQQYKECLSYGYTLSIPELYKKAGIRFDFSQEYVKELADFVKAELKFLDA